MGLLGRLLSYVYRAVGSANSADIKIDVGGGENRTAQHFQPANISSHPLPDDTVAALPIPGAGRVVAVGFNDPNAPDDLLPGETLIYARNDSGEIQVSVKLANDGTLTSENENGQSILNPDGSASLSNGNGGITLEAGGSVNINGLIIDTSGNVQGPGDAAFDGSTLSIAGKNVNGHNHTQPNDTGGDTEAPTDPF